MGRGERHKKISLDSRSEKIGEEGSRAVCRKEYSGKSDKEVEGTSRRVNPQAWMQSTEEGLTGLRCGVRSDDVMDSERWSERCDEAIKRGDSGMPSTTTWAAGFLLRKGQSREALGKWLTSRAVPWRRRRRTLQVITGTFPCGKWRHKIKKRPTSKCE